MIRQVGRLTNDDFKLMDAHVEKIFKALDKGSSELAEKKILEMANTPNYFTREELGKRLATYKGKGNLDEICSRMLEHRLYGIRATALFYFYYKHQDDPKVIVKIIEKTLETVPWESETIAFELWKRHSDVMKEEMPRWAKSDNAKKRAMSMHGMENIAAKDPAYIMNFINNLLDDESEEVQKKITHVLTQVGRMRPVQCYNAIKGWLQDADEKRIRTIWMTMKKLTNILMQKSRRDKTQDFINITQKTVKEWKSDANPNVAQMGAKLAQIMNRPSAQ
ncbi:MAG TPA: DNA alkylation repair protein [Candidatus Cloacimonadota bacterium]|nr:DNA alkylation repair protein [Candidatus Cloacimonadota bacterium]HQL15601.1 DNA alkylation repair protein [Candidatus Cloacimonadota bacterium]